MLSLTMAINCLPKPSRWFSPKGLRMTLHKGKSPKPSSPSLSPASSSASSSSSPSASNKGWSKEIELKEVFGHFDVDNDGKISALELRQYFASIGEYMSYEDARGVIDDLDSDGDHMLDFQDFTRLMNSKEGEGGDGDELKQVFEMFEYEKGSGRITPRGLQRMLNKLGDSKSFDECVAMIQNYDIDGDGELNFNEFYQMMS
ncbi:hypothetical protein Nepgr_025952 [Nepenthes gracilis]|uniref:EF-hand domain-containing protein n=1 Tax=Nepenthes gracilis TaxID=150966 RepID=A0AAD3T7Z9_NEPGR|nr:hypothetical protein Nepgr_025952 [Nepenthes gracilis]